MNKLNKKNVKKGFTLVELIVVIAIVAILAAIAIPSFNGIVKSSRQKAADADAKTIASEVALYIARYDAGENVGDIEARTYSVTDVGSLVKAAFDDSGVQLEYTDELYNNDHCEVTIGGNDVDGFKIVKVELTRVKGASITGTFPKS